MFAAISRDEEEPGRRSAAKLLSNAKYAVKFGSRLKRLIDHNQVNGLAGED